MKYLANAKSYLMAAAIVCICVRVIFWAIEPLLPYLLGGVILVSILGIAIFRSTKL